MNVVIVGGGPAGLYFALLMKLADPAHRITVLERNQPDDTFGWGVVFSDRTLDNFRAADPVTHSAIEEHFAHWDDIDIHVRGTRITSGGHGFSGIARRTLLGILQRRAIELGVELRYGCEVADPSRLDALGLADADLIVGADGVNSVVRRAYAHAFRPDLDVRPARYIWLGTTLPLDAFTFLFVENEHGVFQAHCYRFDAERSTFIVECDERSWRAAGFDAMDAPATIAVCEALFAPWLEGHHLLDNAAHRRARPWQQFVRVSNERWHHGRVVLIGDAAHTAHFSIGSGTKLAMEDAIALARALNGRGTRGQGSGIEESAPGRSSPLPSPDPSPLTPDASSLAPLLQRYEDERRVEALRLQNAARNSMEWFENVRRYIRLEPAQFAYSLLTRSQRVSHESLRLRDRGYLEGVERWFASRADRAAPRGGEPPSEAAPPPMFTPYRLRALTLENRIVVAPMDMYSAADGLPNDFHLVHLGARALGGAALVMTEMVCVSAEGRISPACTGMYAPEHEAAWRRIVEFVHGWSRAAICLQLGHSGRKGSTKRMWEGIDRPLDAGNWPVMAPSALRYAPFSPMPREMTRADMACVRAEFARAARMGAAAGFDMLELHCAHGYLLSSFITPLSNRRRDEYGGGLTGRMRFPLEVLDAIRAEWPHDRPVSVRISATDWADGGVDGAESVEIARLFARGGADIIHVSTGQTAYDAKPVFGRMFQTPFSDRIRNEAGIPTIAVGNITEADQVNSIIAAGRADLVALARPHLSDPNWTLHAAAQLGWRGIEWPSQYLPGRDQLLRTLARQQELVGTSRV
ncbi:MAG TPA: bifunctional salicylyl-CoA 5-hydroxylase/oxidoreductase [Gemmatimonadaceae bacterium]|nr:bifunctional salicylyl-CoA 5-hydroxylase/oxidoreductase [Gemmatimonadaceae bacterium]